MNPLTGAFDEATVFSFCLECHQLRPEYHVTVADHLFDRSSATSFS